MSEEYRTIFCFTEQDRLRKMVEKAQERLYDFMKRYLEAGAGPVFRWYAIESFVEPVMPPSFVDEFIVPYDREIVKLIHDHGCYTCMHCHGRLGAQIERMVQIGIDGTDCTESPPQNDIDLAGMIEKADGKMFVWGYVQFETLARATKEQVYDMVREAVEAGGTEGKYVLSQAASPWMAELPGRSAENLIHMIEAGVKYGGH
jgi:uroporphyrinogen-III decarboxylase